MIWAARHLRMNGRRRLIGSFNHGSMANALPQAIGAQAAYPGRQVVTLSGDGGLAMLLGELITLRQNELPVKVVVFNNGALGFVELEMKAAGIVNFGTELENPDFAAVATALGLHGQRVSDPGELEAALRAAFAHDGPALVEVMVARQELSLPPTITPEQVKGFALWARAHRVVRARRRADRPRAHQPAPADARQRRRAPPQGGARGRVDQGVTTWRPGSRRRARRRRPCRP